MIQNAQEFVSALRAVEPLYFTTAAKVVSVEETTITVELSSGQKINLVTHNHQGKPSVGATCLVTFRDNMQSRPHASDFSLYETIDMDIGGTLVKVIDTEVSVEHAGMSVLLKDNEILVTATTVKITGDLLVSGSVAAEGEVTAMAQSTIVNLSTHMHASATPGAPSPPTPGT